MLRSTSSWPRSHGAPRGSTGRNASTSPGPLHLAGDPLTQRPMRRAIAALARCSAPEGSNPHLRTSHEEAEHPFTWCAARLGQRLGHGSLRMVATARLPIRRPRSAHVPRTGSRRGIHMREQPGHAHSQVRPRRRGVQPGVRDDGCCHRAQHAHHRSLRIARLAPGQPTELEDAARRRVHVALEFPTIRKFPALTASRP
jgi:hypothetical protein